MTSIIKSEERLRQALIYDKSSINILHVLKCDVLYVLNNYMEINQDELNVDINVDEYGFFNVKINAKVRRLKNLHAISV